MNHIQESESSVVKSVRFLKVCSMKFKPQIIQLYAFIYSEVEVRPLCRINYKIDGTEGNV